VRAALPPCLLRPADLHPRDHAGDEIGLSPVARRVAATDARRLDDAAVRPATSYRGSRAVQRARGDSPSCAAHHFATDGGRVPPITRSSPAIVIADPNRRPRRVPFSHDAQAVAESGEVPVLPARVARQLRAPPVPVTSAALSHGRQRTDCAWRDHHVRVFLRALVDHPPEYRCSRELMMFGATDVAVGQARRRHRSAPTASSLRTCQSERPSARSSDWMPIRCARPPYVAGPTIMLRRAAAAFHRQGQRAAHADGASYTPPNSLRGLPSGTQDRRSCPRGRASIRVPSRPCIRRCL